MDTQREKDIDLGSKYEFSPMTQGQCFVNEEQADSLGVKEGGIIYIKMEMYNNLIALINQYNSGVPKNQRINKSIVKQGVTSNVELPCEVTFIGS